MIHASLWLLLALLASAQSPQAPAQGEAPPPVRIGGAGAASESAAPATFRSASADVGRRLEESVAELDALRARIAEEKLPLARRLSELESELSGVRAEFQRSSRLLETRSLDLSNLRNEIKSRQDESAYLSNLLSEYVRNFEAGLHIAELQRYQAQLSEAKLAPENTNLDEQQVFAAQAALLEVALGRLEDAQGGTRFEGRAVSADGTVAKGTFVLVGPAALFLSADGSRVGSAETRLGSLEPALIPFADPLDAQAATQLVREGQGLLPFDPTLGNAHKIEATEDTFVEHVKKGGPVMWPIFALAAAAFLVALGKWLQLLFVRKPSRKKVAALLDALARQDEAEVEKRVQAIRGPIGKMLAAGVAHLREPRELVEEVMYETVLTTKLSLQRMLPFVAICAASAPLLGLLGTVTGIINTFKLITVFGSGDVKTLSGGISEALITTEFGLIIAIPSLLLHAFLARKVAGFLGRMESTAIAFVNQLARTPFERRGEGRAVELVPAPDPELVRAQVRSILNEMLGPIAQGQPDGERELVAAQRGHGA